MSAGGAEFHRGVFAATQKVESAVSATALGEGLECGFAAALGAHGVVLGVSEEVVAAELTVPGLLMPEAGDEEAHRADEEAVADEDDAHVVDLEAAVAEDAHPPVQHADEGDEGDGEKSEGEALPASAILRNEERDEDGIEGEEEHVRKRIGTRRAHPQWDL